MHTELGLQHGQLSGQLRDIVGGHEKVVVVVRKLAHTFILELGHTTDETAHRQGGRASEGAAHTLT